MIAGLCRQFVPLRDALLLDFGFHLGIVRARFFEGRFLQK
jgi:hypothetical protein